MPFLFVFSPKDSGMANISIILPDGSSRELNEGATVGELAASIGAGLAKAAIDRKIDGRMVDLDYPVARRCRRRNNY